MGYGANESRQPLTLLPGSSIHAELCIKAQGIRALVGSVAKQSCNPWLSCETCYDGKSAFQTEAFSLDRARKNCTRVKVNDEIVFESQHEDSLKKTSSTS